MSAQPKLSVVVFTDETFATLRPVVRALAAQTVAEHLRRASAAINAETAQGLSELQRYAAHQLIENGATDHLVCADGQDMLVIRDAYQQQAKQGTPL